MTAHRLPLDPAVLHGCFSRELEPVLTVEPGDSVTFATPNAGWSVGPDETVPRRDPERDTGHALAGPIEVRGARAGQVLSVRIDEVVPGPWGITLSEPPYELHWKLHWELADGLGRGAGRTVRLAPFLGVRDGDRGAVEATVTLDVRDDLELEWPVARVDGAWLAFGCDEHLGVAARIAVDGMLALMAREHGLGRAEALALASVVVDLRVTQVVNDVLGVHAVLRDDAWA